MRPKIVVFGSLILIFLIFFIPPIVSDEYSIKCESKVYYKTSMKTVVNSDCTVTRTLYSGTMFAQNSSGSWVPASDVLYITKHQDDITFHYNGINGYYNITFELGAVYNGNYYSFAQIKQMKPGIKYNFSHTKQISYHKYSVNITNITGNLNISKIENITLTYKNHYGFNLSKLKCGNKWFKIKTTMALFFDDLIERHPMSINKTERRIYISNITANIVDGDLYLDPTVVLQDADTENLDDTYTILSSPDTNYGTSVKMQIYGSSGVSHYGYIEFDTSDIPDGVDILTAQFEGYVIYNQGDEEASPIYAHEIHNWNWDEETPTWNNPVLPVGDLINTTTIRKTGNWILMNVTTWIDYCYKYNNTCTFRLYTGASTGNGIQLVTKENTTETDKRPILRVTHTYPPPDLHDNNTAPDYPNYHNYINISINSTDPHNNEVIEVNFTLTSENSTVLIDNVNGSLWHGDRWNSTTHQIYMNGTYTVNVTTRNNFTIQNSTGWFFVVTYNKPFIFANRTNSSGIQEPRAGDNITIYINVTDGDSDALERINISLFYPNGTHVFGKPINATQDTNEFHSPISHIIATNGTYNIDINVTESTGLNVSMNWKFNITYGSLTVLSPDNDNNWTESIKLGEFELFNLSASHTGNSPNTLQFNFSGNFSNITGINTTFTNPGSIRTVQNDTTISDMEVNVTVNLTSKIDGTRIGYIYWDRTDADGMDSNGSIEINLSVATDTANVDIITPTFSFAKNTDTETTIDFSINNTGNYNATSCVPTFSSTLNPSTSFNRTNFYINYGESSISIRMTIAGGSVGTDDAASFSVECKATVSGGKDSDAIIGSISITAAPGAGSGGGGGGTGGFCGDDVCDVIIENPIICPQDCFCGDGFCDNRMNNVTMQPFETQENCPEDCGEPPEFRETPAFVWEAWLLEPRFAGFSLFSIVWLGITAFVTYSIYNVYKRKKRINTRQKLLLGSVWAMAGLFIFASVGAGTLQGVMEGVQAPFEPFMDNVANIFGNIRLGVADFLGPINETGIYPTEVIT